MGVPPRKYVHRFSAVELNATFHDQGDATYESQAASYQRLGLSVVVKVSGYATHVVGLEGPGEWWPWLREKYAPFAEAGVLLGLLWQFPPSFVESEATLARLQALGAVLRPGSSPGGGGAAGCAGARHVFEFRHSSWYASAPAKEILRRFGFQLARIHIVNDTGWAGDLETGWHGSEEPCPRDFVYLRCFGSRGRSVGKYGQEELCHIASMVRPARTAVVMFGQADVPAHALENAWELQEIYDSGDVDEQTQRWLSAAPPPAPRELVSGTVVDISRSRERRAVLDIGGRRGYLGLRHARKRGLRLRLGAVIDNLQVEADIGAWLIVSIRGEQDA